MTYHLAARAWLFLLLVNCFLVPALAIEPEWKKHTVMKKGHCNTAVALDANGDGELDVVASYPGSVSLFVAPNWKEIPIHQLRGSQNCIHSSVLDVDGDGDLDWAGTVANQHPFWLENPGQLSATWVARPIDHEITGIHCLLTSDINNDGREDLVINNFEPEKGLGDSIAWFEIPENPKSANSWIRHVFASGDARGGSHYMGAGDVDGDGWKEIAVGAKGKPFEDGNWFAFWKNPGDESLNEPWRKVMLATNEVGATNILPADIDGDGKIDWVASRGHGIGLLWLKNPTWAIHQINDDLEFPHDLAVGDFDLDGDIDLAACGFGSEKLLLFKNDGQGEFEEAVLDHMQQSYDLRAIDMDGDGDLDLLNAGRATKNVAWYENPAK